MRFAWIRSSGEHERRPPRSSADGVLLFGYNLIWWIPVVAGMAGFISYRAGLFGFLAITVVRAVVNGYRNNTMPIDKAMYFPLRQP